MRVLSLITKRWAKSCSACGTPSLSGVGLTLAQMRHVAGGGPTKGWGTVPSSEFLLASEQSSGPTKGW